MYVYIYNIAVHEVDTVMVYLGYWICEASTDKVLLVLSYLLIQPLAVMSVILI